jgi:hypothetical protein
MDRRLGRRRQERSRSVFAACFDCREAGGRATQEQLPRARRPKTSFRKNSDSPTLLALGDTVDELDDGVAADGLRVHLMPVVPRDIVQGARNIHSMAREAGICRVRFAFGIPGTLHVGNRAETAFVQIKQAELVRPRGYLALF